jgi:hypothetical protein
VLPGFIVELGMREAKEPSLERPGGVYVPGIGELPVELTEVINDRLRLNVEYVLRYSTYYLIEYLPLLKNTQEG